MKTTRSIFIFAVLDEWGHGPEGHILLHVSLRYVSPI
jgi:hypothetical protein